MTYLQTAEFLINVVVFALMFLHFCSTFEAFKLICKFHIFYLENELGKLGPTLLVPGKPTDFWGVKSVVTSSTLKMTKSQKKLARVCAYTPAYTQIRDGGGKSAPPRVK